MRIGHGYDVHRLEVGRRLRLGGVDIPFERGLVGHSDGDVVLHAVCDAILGALGLQDIGFHFPDSDPEYHGADSRRLAAHVVGLMRECGWAISNVDVTVHAEVPRLGPYRDAMRGALAAVLNTDPARVNVKAKTNEGLDAIGQGQAIAASAVVLLHRADD